MEADLSGSESSEDEVTNERIANDLEGRDTTDPGPETSSLSKDEKEKRVAKRKERREKKREERKQLRNAEFFVDRMKSLLEIERESEIEETKTLLETLPPKELVARGLLLPKLEIIEQFTGFGGKHVITLQSIQGDVALPENKFTPGDIVGLKDETSGSIVESGVIARVYEKRVQVATSKPNATDGFSTAIYALVLLTNNVTYKRMEKAVADLKDKYETVAIGRLLFNENPTLRPVVPVDFTPLNLGLNQSQIDAIKFALGSKELALIHGPPGTGKTTTIVELIIQSVKRGERVLAVAPSNIAIDNIAERLIKSKAVKLVRIGHPARFLPQVVNHCLDTVIQNSNGGEVVRGIKEDMDQVQKDIELLRGGQRSAKWREWRELKQELKKREVKAAADAIKECQVVLATCSGAGDRNLRAMNDFDLVVIDEAAQALEPQCWIALLKGKRAVLAGDHLQLPPTIHSEKAAKSGLSVTLFERIIKIFGDDVAKLLSVQYRMHEGIMNWSSKAMYKNKLTAHESVKAHLLTDLPLVRKSPSTSGPLVFIDSAGCDLTENEDNEGSKYNEGEAKIVAAYINELIESGVSQTQVAVIAPYFAQVRLLREMLHPVFPRVDVNTVDGFQGREQEAIIITMVRSNKRKKVGFLKENRRMNVAVTRAKRQCVLIGDSETVSKHPFLKLLLAHFEKHGEYWSASQYLSNNTVDLSSIANSIETSSTQTSPSTKTESSSAPAAKVITDVRAQILEFKNSKEAVLKFDRPLSKKNLEILLTAVKDQGLFAVERKQKGAVLYDVFKEEPKEEEGPAPLIASIVKEEKKPEPKPQPQPKIEPKPTGNTTGSNPTKNQSSDQLAQIRAAKAKDFQQQGSAPPKKAPPSSSSAPATKSSLAKPNAVLEKEKKFAEMDDDEALEAALAEVDKCHFPECKATTQLVSYLCAMCKFKYCIKHRLPEIHGCAAQAKKNAQQDFKKQGGVIQEKPKKLSAANRNNLARKLQKKVDEGEASRSKKPKEEEKK